VAPYLNVGARRVFCDLLHRSLSNSIPMIATRPGIQCLPVGDGSQFGVRPTWRSPPPLPPLRYRCRGEHSVFPSDEAPPTQTRLIFTGHFRRSGVSRKNRVCFVRSAAPRREASRESSAVGTLFRQ
jgi:hypothetical protein